MTSSASTGRCPSFITPPRSMDGSRADPESACGGLDPEAADGLRERVRVFEPTPVVVPANGRPDLRVIARADDDGLPFQAGHLSQVGRDEDPTLAVETDLDGAGEDEPREEAGGGGGGPHGRPPVGRGGPSPGPKPRRCCFHRHFSNWSPVRSRLSAQRRRSTAERSTATYVECDGPEVGRVQSPS